MAASSSRPSPPKPHERARGFAPNSLDDALIPASGRNQLVRSARDTLDLNRDNFSRGMDRDYMTPFERERSLATGMTGGYSSLHNPTNSLPPRPPPRTGLLSDQNRPFGSSFGSSSMYGGGSGGGGMYGGASSLYNRPGYGMGSMYGSGMYGSGMYGGGGGGMLNPYSRDPKFLGPYDNYGYGMGGYVSNSFGWVNDFQSLVQTFAQISWLLDANFETLGGAFGSMFRFLTRARSLTATELTPIVQVLLFFSALGVAGAKLTQFLRGSAGRAALQSGDDLAAFEHFATAPVKSSTAIQKSPLRRFAWLLAIVVLLGTMFGAPLLMNLLARVFRRNSAQQAVAASDVASSKKLMRVRALYDFEGETRDDLQFRRGDVIEVIEQRGEWLEGRSLETGRVGLVPLNFVRPLPLDDRDRNVSSRPGTDERESESLQALDLGASAGAASSSRKMNG